ncbi:hypothetical protein RHS03_03507, partial [Rhizoctonia solani]
MNIDQLDLTHTQSNGNLQGVVYAYGLDDDEDDDSNGAFQLFRSLMGDDTLSKSTITISSDLGEPTIDLENVPQDIHRTILSRLTRDTCFNLIDQFLEPNRAPTLCGYQREITDKKFMGSTTAGRLFEQKMKDAQMMIERALGHIHGRPLSPSVPFSPISPTPRRRPIAKLSGLASELAQVRRQFDELQDAYAALESNCAEQTTQLEESVLELRTRDGGLRAENDSLRAEINALNATLNELRPKPRQNQVVSRDNAVQTDPPPEEKPTRSDMQAEALSLKTQLAESKLAEAKAIKDAANLSEELTKAKSPLMEVQRANAELKKKVGLLEKQAENTTKTIEAKKDEVEKAKSEATKLQSQLKSTRDELEKVQRQLKESAAAKSKLEDERSKAISVSESALKAKENVEKELVVEKARIGVSKNESQKEIDRLKKSIAEKEAHIGEIARAAEVWTLASAEAKSLKEELKLLQTCADARQREIQTELCEARDEYKRATIEWDLERTRLDSSILALTQTGEKTRSDLDRTIEFKDKEAQGYVKRIAELEEWGKQRWDAIGGDCIIA